jgi:hypothetical protein
MKKNYGLFLFLLFILIGTFSCRKANLDVTNENVGITSEAKAAKDWYETQFKKSKTNVKINIGFLKEQLAWEQLESIEKDNILLVPFNILDAKNNKAYLELLKNENGEIVSAKYLFLLSNELVDNTKAQDLIISKQNIGNFSGAIIEYDLNNNLLLSNTYKNGIEDKSVEVKIEMKNVSESQNRSIDGECQEQVCTAWYWVIYDTVTGQIYGANYLYTSCYCGGGPIDTGGGGVSDVDPNESQNSSANICKNSFIFKVINDRPGGWQVAGTKNIHMNIVDLTTGVIVPVYLPTIYFGLPVTRVNGEHYSLEDASNFAAQAVNYAETQVMLDYHSNYVAGDIFNLINTHLKYRQYMNSYMQSHFSGSASLTSGTNITITNYGTANYSWPWIGCL